MLSRTLHCSTSPHSQRAKQRQEANVPTCDKVVQVVFTVWRNISLWSKVMDCITVCSLFAGPINKNEVDCSCYWKTHYLKLEVERGLNPHTIKGDAFQNLGEWLRVPRVGFKLPTLEQAIPKFLVSCVTCAYWADFGKSPHKNKIEMNMCLTQARAATVFSLNCQSLHCTESADIRRL